jgi:uncharacterized membrane protein YkoI
MNLLRLSLTRAVALANVLLVSSIACAKEQHQARFPLEAARAKALSIAPGAVVSEELEQEGGRWIYSFEIKPTNEKQKLVKEVNIDADTGALAGIETENE